MFKRPSPSLIQDRRASAAIEFGLTAPMIILALVGCIELGRAFWIRAALQFAAEETVRYAMVNTNADDAALTAYAHDRLFGLEAEEASFSINRETVGGADFVQVQGDYPFQFISHLIPMAATTLTGSARASQAE